jgi:hypothetical protein
MIVQCGRKCELNISTFWSAVPAVDAFVVRTKEKGIKRKTELKLFFSKLFFLEVQ